MTSATDALLIIGTGLAGYTLAREFRKLNSERPLILLTSDDGRSYSKPLLSTGFSKHKQADELAMASAAQMAQQLKADIRSHVTVSAIDTKARTVTVDGETLAYGDLVLAQGAGVFRPPLAGNAPDKVLSINDLIDYGHFRTALANVKRVLIIGGGLIGCEFANDLSNGGFQVQVVEPMGRALPTLLPAEASAAVTTGLESLGVRFHFGPSVKAVDHDPEGGVIATLSDGSTANADLVLSAVGLRPRTALAQAAGINVNRGICTDRELRTSAAHVYALGDCAEVQGLVLLYVLPLMAAARALARTLAGDTTPVQYPAMPVVIKTPVCPVVVQPVAPGTEGQWQISAEGADTEALFYAPDGQLLGFALTGAPAQNPARKAELTRQLPALLV